jgi:hypothetical protein
LQAQATPPARREAREAREVQKGARHLGWKSAVEFHKKLPFSMENY